MNARRIRDGAIAVAIGFGATVAAFAAGELRSRRVVDLGDLDLEAHCEALYGSSTKAIPLGWSTTGWICVDTRRVDVYHQVDFDAACRLEYGRSDAMARSRDGASPYSWYCVHT